ncbi:hypothetical protein [Chryseobacterium angstadtii]|uniref:hypothetical protein n=1 Tax=Chryseobacterium angstadtii TaxID=558151 RepID=UPI000B1039D9|nr:hypothetical protein [Chryseobacterium angstadtii]
MKKFPLIIPTSEKRIHCEVCTGKTCKSLEKTMNTISSMNWSKSLSNFPAIQ